MTVADPAFLYRLPQNVSLGSEFDSLGADGSHGLLYLLSLSYGFKVIPAAIFNNQGDSEYWMRKQWLYGSGYLMMEIRFCLMGESLLNESLLFHNLGTQKLCHRRIH